MYEPEAVYKFDAWDTSLDWCIINYSVEVDNVPLSLVSGVNQTSDGFIRFDNPSRTLKIGYSDDNSAAGTMTVKIIGNNLNNLVTHTKTFTLTKIKSCKYAELYEPTVDFTAHTSEIGSAVNTEWLLQYTTNDTAHCDADIEYDAYFDTGYTSTTSLPAAY